MTKREIFNRVRDHLLLQGAQSRGPLGNWTYRGRDGHSCAVGCLIKDEFYTPELEGYPFNGDNVLEALQSSGIDALDDDIYSLLRALQRIHDSYEPEAWREQLTRLEATL